MAHPQLKSGLPKKKEASADNFPISVSFSDFGDSVVMQPGQQTQKAERRHNNWVRREQARWIFAVLAIGLYGAAIFILAQLHLLRFETFLWVTAASGVWAAVGVWLVAHRSRQPRVRRASKEGWVLLALLCMLAVFYQEPASQMVMTPFVFLALSHDQYRISRRVLIALGLLVLVGSAGIILMHYRRYYSMELLQISALQWLALALALPLFIYQVTKIQRLHQVVVKASERMKHIQAEAKRDVLLDCYSRRYVVAALEAQKQWADERGTSALCLAVLDLDHFKNINDRWGHLMGDEVLRRFSQLAQREVRSGDIFGRYGGEEFLLIFTQSSLHGAYSTLQRIRLALEKLVFENASDLKVTVSIGVTVYQSGESLLELFSRADNAMYAAKQGGRNQVFAEQQAHSDRVNGQVLSRKRA